MPTDARRRRLRGRHQPDIGVVQTQSTASGACGRPGTCELAEIVIFTGHQRSRVTADPRSARKPRALADDRLCVLRLWRPRDRNGDEPITRCPGERTRQETARLRHDREGMCASVTAAECRASLRWSDPTAAHRGPNHARNAGNGSVCRAAAGGPKRLTVIIDYCRAVPRPGRPVQKQGPLAVAPRDPRGDVEDLLIAIGDPEGEGLVAPKPARRVHVVGDRRVRSRSTEKYRAPMPDPRPV